MSEIPAELLGCMLSAALARIGGSTIVLTKEELMIERAITIIETDEGLNITLMTPTELNAVTNNGNPTTVN